MYIRDSVRFFFVQLQVDKTRWFLVSPNGLENMNSEHWTRAHTSIAMSKYSTYSLNRPNAESENAQKNPEPDWDWKKSHEQREIDSMNFWMQCLESISLIFWEWHHAFSEHWMADSYWLLLHCIALDSLASLQYFSLENNFLSEMPSTSCEMVRSVK